MYLNRLGFNLLQEQSYELAKGKEIEFPFFKGRKLYQSQVVSEQTTVPSHYVILHVHVLILYTVTFVVTICTVVIYTTS